MLGQISDFRRFRYLQYPVPHQIVRQGVRILYRQGKADVSVRPNKVSRIGGQTRITGVCRAGKLEYFDAMLARRSHQSRIGIAIDMQLPAELRERCEIGKTFDPGVA